MAHALIVEDDAPLRRIITINLARRGHSVAEADSVESAVEALSYWAHPFDLILLDVGLADGTGWDVLRHLATAGSSRGPQEANGPAEGRKPKVIVMSAVRPAQCRVEEFQPAAVLVKPFPLQALFRLIERVLAAAPAASGSGELGSATDGDQRTEIGPPGPEELASEAAE